MGGRAPQLLVKVKVSRSRVITTDTLKVYYNYFKALGITNK